MNKFLNRIWLFGKYYLYKKLGFKMDYWVDLNRVFSPTERDPLPLVHITNTWDKLKLILEEGFKPNYSTEYLTNGKERIDAAFPMVSFSSLTIDEAISYQRPYGTLGIVVQQSWGQINQLNPVLYLEEQSDLTNEVINCFHRLKKNAFHTNELRSSLKGELTGDRHMLASLSLKLFFHSKNYEGQLVRGNTLLCDKYQYGLEREWRKIAIGDDIEPFLIGEKLKEKAKYSESLKAVRYKFNLEQIICVIVETELEIEEAKKILLKVYGVDTLPNTLQFRLNTLRHMPDEG